MGLHAKNKKKRRRSRAAAVSTVLDNNDLLGEVLLRVALPTSLVRAALVCRRWLRVAADPAFLLRFHDRHPPRLLGFYVHSAHLRGGVPKFAPMPGLPPELTASARRAGSALDAFAPETSTASVLYCLDGHLLVRLGPPGSHRDVVLSPMRPRRPAAVLVVPPPPFPPSLYDHDETWLKRRDDDDGFPNRRRGGVTVCAAWRRHADPTISCRYELRGGAWHEQLPNSSAAAPNKAAKLPAPPLAPNKLVDSPYFFLRRGDKMYLVSSASAIAELRSASANSSETTSHLTFVALPDGVKLRRHEQHKLHAWTDNSVIHLIKVGTKKMRLRVWLYRLESQAWSLEDTVCLRTLLAGSGAVTSLFSGQDRPLDVVIQAAGPRRSAMCVLLQVAADVLYININNRTVEKVYTLTPDDGGSVTLAPFNMIFPPVFPVIKDHN